MITKVSFPKVKREAKTSCKSHINNEKVTKVWSDNWLTGIHNIIILIFAYLINSYTDPHSR
jgi:hypothetical protein